MKHIKLFEEFLYESNQTLFLESTDYSDALDIVKTMIDTKSEGKFGLFWVHLDDNGAKKDASELGLTADGNKVLIASSNNQAELNKLKKEYNSKISTAMKKSSSHYGTGLQVEAIK